MNKIQFVQKGQIELYKRDKLNCTKGTNPLYRDDYRDETEILPASQEKIKFINL